MQNPLFALIPEERLLDALDALRECSELPVRLLDAQGRELASFGEGTRYCAILKQRVFRDDECVQAHRRAGEQARRLGEAYIFSCHASLNHIAFPLIDRDALLGSILIGPFLMDAPDSTLVSSLTERYPLPPGAALELFEELQNVPVVAPRRVTSLSRLVDHLLSPLMPGGRAALMLAREKLSQQSLINETIQRYKEQDVSESGYEAFHEKENLLLSRAREGDADGAKALLVDLMGRALMDGRADEMRLRAMELTTLLSRVAMDGGANAESVHLLAGRFLSMMQAEKRFESVCLLVQEALVGFMEAMYSAQDKGNPYVRKALRCMSRRYFQPLTMASVAAEVGLSANYFSSLFRRVVGESFSDRLNRIRIEESKRLLLATDDPIAQIAVSIGFSDQSYFCKVFRRYVGVSPGRFRA